METKVCSKCKTEKNVNDFRYRNKFKGTRACWCKECFSTYEKNVWASSEQRRKTNMKNNRLRKIRNYDFVSKFLSDKSCKDCGENDVVVLEFDHLGGKRFGISYCSSNSYGLETLKKEISKCEVVCANCHRRRTAARRGYRRLNRK